MTCPIRIAVDAMGGEFGPRVTVSALLLCLARHSNVTALVFGDRLSLEAELTACSDSNLRSRVVVRHSGLTVSDHDKPSVVLRTKQSSSMGLAVKAVLEEEADACISAGNTGALMALGLVNLKTLPGISRPAICTTFPTMSGRTYVLDLGANIDCSAEQLHQFGMLGTLTARLLDGVDDPRVGLLNVGKEATKGSESLQSAAALLDGDESINYGGFLEGDEIFKGTADVVVCDGFSGNIALKTSEGLANMITSMLDDLLSKSWLARLTFGLVNRSFKQLIDRLNPAFYNGAYLLGLNGVVVKSHGSASQKAFGHALDVAIEAAEHNLPKALAPLLERKLIESKSDK